MFDLRRKKPAYQKAPPRTTSSSGPSSPLVGDTYLGYPAPWPGPSHSHDSESCSSSSYSSSDSGGGDSGGSCGGGGGE